MCALTFALNLVYFSKVFLSLSLLKVKVPTLQEGVKTHAGWRHMGDVTAEGWEVGQQQACLACTEPWVRLSPSL